MEQHLRSQSGSVHKIDTVSVGDNMGTHMYTVQGGGVDGRNNGTHRHKAYEVPVQLMYIMAAAIGEVCKGAPRSRAGY